mgnify:CR=1 FL=1
MGGHPGTDASVTGSVERAEEHQAADASVDVPSASVVEAPQPNRSTNRLVGVGAGPKARRAAEDLPADPAREHPCEDLGPRGGERDRAADAVVVGEVRRRGRNGAHLEEQPPRDDVHERAKGARTDGIDRHDQRMVVRRRRGARC